MLVKKNTECLEKKYGNTLQWHHKTGTASSNLQMCEEKARKLGSRLFVACSNVRGHYCYTYKKLTGDTCVSKHNKHKCNLYRITGAANCNAEKKTISDLAALMRADRVRITKLEKELAAAKKKSCIG